MSRYFIEVAYKGTHYAGFQIQQNANTIQAEVEKALQIYYRQSFCLTGSSRTDAGVHAKQNFFHFDTTLSIDPKTTLYHLNAILPLDIVINSIRQVNDNAHCRFDAMARRYQYNIYHHKNPFFEDTAFYMPFPLDVSVLNEAAAMLLSFQNFKSFSKKHTQVYTYICALSISEWVLQEDLLTYTVKGNRFLRGMVRGLVGTMLQVAKGKYSLAQFNDIIKSEDSKKTDFSTPAKGLTLQSVMFNN